MHSRYQFGPFCKLDALFIYHFSPICIFRSIHLTLFPICIRWTNFLVFSFNTFNHASTYKLSMIGSTPCTKKVEWLSGLKVRKDKSSNFHHRPTSNDYLDNFHHRRTSNDYLDQKAGQWRWDCKAGQELPCRMRSQSPEYSSNSHTLGRIILMADILNLRMSFEHKF